MRDDGASDQSGSSQGEKWRLDSRDILYMEPRKFPNGLKVRCKKKKSEKVKRWNDP